jgi:hypothetical protein
MRIKMENNETSPINLLLQTQQKMSDDIADIKATIKETAQIMLFIRKDHDELKMKVDRLESNQLSCPARIRAQNWYITSKDLLWFFTVLAAIASVIVLFKR